MANKALGDIIKVTPSSKVAGDLALFMVQNKLDLNSVVDQAANLDFPDSVLSFMNGRLGVPAGGFPEPFRSRVLKGKAPQIPDGERPGTNMISMDFELEKKIMTERTGLIWKSDEENDEQISDFYSHFDVVSHALYPEVHRDFRAHMSKYSDTSMLPTPFFFSAMKVGEEINFHHREGREAHIRLVAIGHTTESGFKRVFFEVNNLQNSFDVQDRNSKEASNVPKREKADVTKKGSVGCPMKGLIVDITAAQGDMVNEGEPLAVLSAMKMETIISAPCTGRIMKFFCATGDALDQGDLIVII
jgi:pyruvate carboxylase